MTKLLTTFRNEAHRKEVMSNRIRRAIWREKERAAIKPAPLPPVPRMTGSVRKQKEKYQYLDGSKCWVCKTGVKHSKPQHDEVVESQRVHTWWFSGDPK